MITLEDVIRKFPSAPDYLSNVFLIARDYDYVNNARLADWMNVSRPAVTQAVKRMASQGLVEQDEFGMISLTEDGRVIAKAVLRRHYLLEHLLVGVLQYPWDKSDAEAKRLQDKVSQDFVDHLYERLGRPRTCPHGNPFPDEEDPNVLKAPRLTDAHPGDLVKILRITEEGEDIDGLLSSCYELGIRPGRSFVIQEVGEDAVTLSASGAEGSLVLPANYAHFVAVEFPEKPQS